MKQLQYTLHKKIIKKNDSHSFSFNKKLKLNKKGIYSILSAFLLIIVTLIVIIGLVFIISSMALFEVNIMDKYKSDITTLNIKDMVQYCYGGIINETGNFDTGCLGSSIDKVKGITVTTLLYESCQISNITIINPQGYTQSEVFYVPVYQNNKKIICPGKLNIYT
jgi:hypothetical protein